jgi:hypothetical protein
MLLLEFTDGCGVLQQHSHLQILFVTIPQACQCIPRGKVATYGLLAELLGSSARAVGQVRCPWSYNALAPRLNLPAAWLRNVMMTVYHSTA